MIVIAVGPPGAVNLPGGDAHTAQGGYGQHTFLAAAAQRPAQHGQGSQGPIIGGGVGGMGIAPVVDRKGGLLHGFSPDMGQQFDQQKMPAGIQILGIDPVVQHIGEENLRWNGIGVFQLFHDFQGGPDISGQHLWGS